MNDAGPQPKRQQPPVRGAPEPPLAARDRMPRWVPRAILLFFAGTALLYITFWLGIRLRSLIVMFLVALFLALATEPAVNRLARRGWRRGAATGLVFFGVFLCIVVFVSAIGSLFVDQVTQLVSEFPRYVEAGTDWLNGVLRTDFSGNEIANEIRNSSRFQNFAQGVAVTALGAGTTLIGLVFQVFTIGLFAFYLTAEGPTFRRTVCSMLRPEQQYYVLQVWDLAIEKTGGYVYSRGLLAAISAVATWLVLTILGVPYSLALGLWVGLVSQFVPTVGTYLAGAVPVLVALLADPIDALWVLGFILAYQQVENYVLSPRITAHTMSLNPAVAFGSVIAGAAILGGVGALLALPVVASVQAFISTYVRRYEVVRAPLTEDPGAAETSPAEAQV